VTEFTDSDWRRLIDFFEGRLSPDERAALDRWIGATPERAAAVDRLHAAWRVAAETSQPSWPSETMWKAVAPVQGEAAHELISQRTPPRTRRVPGIARFFRGTRGPMGGTAGGASRERIGMLAVGAVLGLGLATVFYHVTATPSHERTAYAVYSTRPGQRAMIDLPDGTRVLLNVASTLTVPRTLGDGDRTVQLIGQAAFTVNHAGSAPFVVAAAGTRTAVLGTTFGVRAYDADVRVAVESGRVSVTPCAVAGVGPGCMSRGEPVVLDANDVADVTAGGRIRARRGTDVEPEFAFSNGRLVLTGAPLGDVVADLSRWYDADIRLADSAVAHRVLEGTFTGETLDALVRSLSVVLNVRVERRGRVITVYSSPPTPGGAP
jgi:ferric-dicitrate binding protein FerR (iron transport regulator)